MEIKRASNSEWSIKNVELGSEYKCTFFKLQTINNKVTEITRDIKETDLDTFSNLISNFGFIIYIRQENKEKSGNTSTCWKCQ